MATPKGPKWEKFKKEFAKTEAGKILASGSTKTSALKKRLDKFGTSSFASKYAEKNEATERARHYKNAIPANLRRK